MWLPLVIVALLSKHVYSQGTDAIGTIQLPEFWDHDQASYITYVWEGEVGHELNNITMELMSGKAEDNGDDVADIIIFNLPQSDGDTISYLPHAATPTGEYYIRMNGTVYNGNTPLGTTMALSSTFDLILDSTSEAVCAPPPWTPVRSVTNPAYRPLRITRPAGGDVFSQTQLSDPYTGLVVNLIAVDALFDENNMNLTLELVTTATDYSALTLTVPSNQTDQFSFNLITNRTLNPGTWQVRANYTSKGTENPGSFVTLSDEFYISIDGSCPAGNSSSSSSNSPSSSTSESGASSAERHTGASPGWVLFSLTLGSCLVAALT